MWKHSLHSFCAFAGVGHCVCVFGFLAETKSIAIIICCRAATRGAVLLHSVAMILYLVCQCNVFIVDVHAQRTSSVWQYIRWPRYQSEEARSFGRFQNKCAKRLKVIEVIFALMTFEINTRNHSSMRYIFFVSFSALLLLDVVDVVVHRLHSVASFSYLMFLFALCSGIGYRTNEFNGRRKWRAKQR